MHVLHSQMCSDHVCVGNQGRALLTEHRRTHTLSTPAVFLELLRVRPVCESKVLGIVVELRLQAGYPSVA